MAITVTPNNYGLKPYGVVSYAAYLSIQPTPSPVVVVPLIESLTNKFLPAYLKVYYEFE